VNPKTEELLLRQGIELDRKIISDLSHFTDLLERESEKTNLVSAKDRSQLWTRHILDSLMPIAWGWKWPGRRCCDVGSGGGLPGVVLALTDRGNQWTLVETIQRKAAWLEAVRDYLNLNRLNVIRERAEELGSDPDFREVFDLGTSRALAPGKTMLEYCLPLIREGGELWSWQGNDFRMEAWDKALAILGGSIVEVKPYRIPGDPESHQRRLVRILKESATPVRYPRNVGIPSKRPL